MTGFNLTLEDCLRLFFEESPDGIIICDMKGNLVSANNAMLKLFGLAKDEILGKQVFDLFYPEDLKKDPLQFQQVAEGTVINRVRRLKINGNKTVFADITARVSSQGLVVGRLKDITIEKMREERLRTMAEMLDEAPNSITIHNPKGNFLYANKKTFEIHGYEEKEFMNLSLYELDVPASAEKIEERMAEIAKKGFAMFEVAHFHKDRHVIPLEIYVKKVTWLGEPSLLSIARDISDQRAAEQKLKESEEKFREIAENTSDVIWVMDDKLQYTYVSPSILKQRGWTPEEFLQLPMEEIYTPESLQIVRKTFQDGLKLFRKGKIPKDYSVTLVLKHKCKDGSIRISEVHTNPMISSENKILGVHGISRDITQRYLAQQQLEEAKKKAEESSRLKTAFLNNISHEIRTPMNSILGFAEILDDAEYSDEERKRFRQIITSNANQLMRIIDDVLEVSRLDSERISLNISTFNINDLMQNLYDSMAGQIKKRGISFSWEPGNEPEKVMLLADRSKIEQVLTGLLVNAGKFTKKGSIVFGYTLMDETIRFYVRDTGIGIPKEEQQKVFERFYVIRDDHSMDIRGTGLGLSIARGIVDLMGGTLHLASTVDRGSTFYFDIPYETQKEEDVVPSEHKPWKFDDLRILIAEDDTNNFEFVRMILQKKVAKIWHALDGEEALILHREQHPDLILMDLKMPNLDGLEAVKKIRETDSETPIIALTAYAQPEDEQQSLNAGCQAFASKPIKKSELLDVIRIVME
jgi:PAS domain S-box-containing protein